MARVVSQNKSAAVNPLKSSQPLGAAFAFLGVDGAIPLLHGSQGCTSFALALLVRHFNEAIPLQTTAMNETAIIVGGADRLEEAILSLKARTRPRLIGICTTASVEARDEDVAGDVENIKRKRAIELVGTEVVLANTPDFDGAIEEGWSKAVTAMIEAITRPEKQYRDAGKIAILPGCNLTVADIEHLRETAVSFGLDPVILPDVSGALDGSIPEEWMPTTYGGTKVQEIRDLGTAMQCIAIGEHMRRPAEALQRLTRVPYVLFRSLTGLENVDRFIRVLAALSRKQAPLTSAAIECSCRMRCSTDISIWQARRSQSPPSRISFSSSPIFLLPWVRKLRSQSPRPALRRHSRWYRRTPSKSVISAIWRVSPQRPILSPHTRTAGKLPNASAFR